MNETWANQRVEATAVSALVPWLAMGPAVPHPERCAK
jgi:hypothetical protein